MCELGAGQFRASGTRRQLDGRVQVPGQRGRADWATGGWGHPGWEEGTCLLARMQRELARCSRSFRLKVQPGRLKPTRHGPLAGEALASCSEQRCPRSRGQLCPHLGLGHHQQPRGGTEPAGALQGLGEGLPWPWLRLAEVSQRWPSWWLWEWRCSQDWGPGAGSPFGAERMGGVARDPQRCTLGRPRPTELPSPCWGPRAGQGRLGGPPHPQQREVSPLRGRGRDPA